MSVCFFVPADNSGASNVAEEVEAEVVEDMITAQNNCQQTLQQFWAKVTEDIKKVNPDHFKTQALPLARIKKIMKLDEDVKMISGEAPVLFAKAAEIFIHELTLRAWAHTEDNKRRTLQRNDIAMAISKSDQFDFLIDIVPRHEVKCGKPREDTHRTTTVTEQTQQHQTTMQNNTATAPQQIVVQPCAQVVQQASSSSGGSASVQMPAPVALVQQVVTPQGDIQQVPIQLTQAQLNMIRLQVQNNPSQPIIIQAQAQQSPQLIQLMENNPSQPIIIQAQAQQSPQLIQVSSQGQHQPQQQVFLAQVQTSQDDS